MRIYDSSEAQSFAVQLYEHVFNEKYRSQQLADLPINEQQQRIIDDYVLQILEAVPLQYITGYAYFGQLKLHVNKHVLIPRPETEELCALITAQYKQTHPLSILDIGCGSGCISAYLKTEVPQAEVSAIDISTDALAVAAQNTQHLDVTLIQADILSTKTLPRRYDVIVSNPPYVLSSEKCNMHQNVLKHEPHLALFVDDNDALIFYKHMCTLAQQYLNPGGQLFFEINNLRAQELLSYMQETQLMNARILKDMFGVERFAVAQQKI